MRGDPFVYRVSVETSRTETQVVSVGPVVLEPQPSLHIRVDLTGTCL